MDVNEIIVNVWLNECKEMYSMNTLYYDTNNQDIDILAISLFQKEIWDCEVKVRTSTTMLSFNSNDKSTSFKKINDAFISPKRIKKIEKLNPLKFEIKRKLITTKSFLGKKVETQNEKLCQIMKNNIEVIFIEDIMTELVQYAISESKSTNPIVQTLRLLKRSPNAIKSLTILN